MPKTWPGGMLTVSLGLHALAFYSLCVRNPGGAERPALKEEPFTLVQYTPPAPLPAHPVVSVEAVRKVAEIVKPAPRPVRSRLQKISYYKDQKQRKERLAAPAPSDLPGSDELMTDPQKGKIFSAYFGGVKKKLQRVVHQKYELNPGKKGRVSLFFVLSEDGSLEFADVLERGSAASQGVRELAKECVTEAAPFDRFPKELPLDRISFNVSILFEES